VDGDIVVTMNMDVFNIIDHLYHLAIKTRRASAPRVLRTLVYLLCALCLRAHLSSCATHMRASARFLRIVFNLSLSSRTRTAPQRRARFYLHKTICASTQRSLCAAHIA